MKNAPVIAAAPGIIRDEITGERIPDQMLMHCDGEYAWLSDLIHYFDIQDFINHALNWKMIKTKKAWEKEVKERVRGFMDNNK